MGGKVEKARMRGGAQGGPGGPGVSGGESRGLQGGSRGGPEVLGGKTAKTPKKQEKRSGTVWLACRRFQ